MPRAIDQAALDAIVDLVAAHPEGMGRADLERAYKARFGAAIGSRTLQRYLRRLVRDDRIVASGEGRSTRYYLAVSHDPEGDAFQPSADGLAIQRLVRRPLSQRAPVGYHPDLLLDYNPGTTWYLDEAMRNRLHAQGRTPADQRPAGTFARDILDRLLIDLSWASSRLEGNTYSRLDTKNLIEFGQRAEGKQAEEAQMILNHKQAIELLVDHTEDIAFDLYTFGNLHSALSENLMSDPADEGRLRRRTVQISGSVFLPLAIPQQIEEYFRLILEKAARIPDPFEQAFFVLVHVPYLQPFADVNKRVSRLAANIPLIKANLCPVSFIEVSNRAYVEGLLGMYELNRWHLMRDVFVWAYERSTRQYLAIRESVAMPDPLRMRYRDVLANILAATVQSGEAPARSRLRQHADGRISPEDMERFVELALSELLNLHEGSIARYGIRPDVFQDWRAKWTHTHKT